MVREYINFYELNIQFLFVSIIYLISVNSNIAFKSIVVRYKAVTIKIGQFVDE